MAQLWKDLGQVFGNCGDVSRPDTAWSLISAAIRSRSAPERRIVKEAEKRLPEMLRQWSAFEAEWERRLNGNLYEYITSVPVGCVPRCALYEQLSCEARPLVRKKPT